MNATQQCKAEEWQRDGRGLWAMRACINHPEHGERHVFSAWRYNVKPPSVGAVDPHATSTGTQSPREESSSSSRAIVEETKRTEEPIEAKETA